MRRWAGQGGAAAYLPHRKPVPQPTDVADQHALDRVLVAENVRVPVASPNPAVAVARPRTRRGVPLSCAHLPAPIIVQPEAVRHRIPTNQRCAFLLSRNRAFLRDHGGPIDAMERVCACVA